MITQDSLLEKVQQLSNDNDAHWTPEGLPNPDFVFTLLSESEQGETGLENMAKWIEWAAPEVRRVIKQEEVVVDQAPAEQPQAPVEGGTAPVVIADEVAEVDPLAQAAADVAEAERVMEAAKKSLAAAREAQDKVTADFEESNKENPIADYLERQKQNLQERGEKVKFLRENRTLLDDVFKVKSPLDNSLSSRPRTS